MRSDSRKLLRELSCIPRAVHPVARLLAPCLAWANVLLLTALGTAQETPGRKDALGDSLPIAAEIRYGTSRLRHEQPVQTVTLSPDGRFIASSARDFSVRIWDRATGALVHSLPRCPQSIGLGCSRSKHALLTLYSPDGKYLVAGRGDANLFVWDTSSYKLLHKMSGSSGAIQALAIAPDSKTCASSDSEQTVRLWSLSTGKETKQHAVQSSAAQLTFAHEGSQLIAGCNDGTIHIFQVDPLSQTRVIEAHESPIQHQALAPSGNTLASIGRDKAIRFWDSASGKPTLSWPPSSGPHGLDLHHRHLPAFFKVYILTRLIVRGRQVSLR